MSIRTERVARLVQREVADLLQRDYADQLRPLVTITGSRVSADLSIAYLQVSILAPSDAERKTTFARLEQLRSDIRASLASRIRHQVRRIPEVRFFLDDTAVEAEKMEHLFDKIRQERSDRGGDED